MRIPFLIGQYKGRSGAINVSECINLFAESDVTGGDGFAYIGTPGLKQWCDTGTGRGIRGMHVGIGTLYVVSGDKFFSIDTSGTATEIATIGTSTGTVTIKDNTKQICIIDGTSGYIYTPSTSEFKEIGDTAFNNADSLTYQDGYFIANIPDSRQFQISNLYDGLKWDGIDYATKEGYPDNVVSTISVHRYLFILGEETSEVWSNTGSGTFPFQRINGANMEYGCAAVNSPAVLDNTLYWLTNTRQIARATGSAPQIISTQQIDYQIAQYSVVDDAIGYSMTFEGHPWYRLSFKGANKTWAYDAKNNLWHSLSSWDETNPSIQGRHRGAAYAYYDDRHLIGDYANGIIYETLSTYYTDFDRPIQSVGIGRIIHQDRRELAFNRFELEFETGIGAEYDYLVDEAGRYIFGADGTYMSGASATQPDPLATIDWTDNGGKTWSNPRVVSLQTRGNYDRVKPLDSLGSSRDRAFRIRISDPVKRVLVAAYADITASRA